MDDDWENLLKNEDMTTSVIMCYVKILILMRALGDRRGDLLEVRFLEHFLVIKIFELILHYRAIDL